MSAAAIARCRTWRLQGVERESALTEPSHYIQFRHRPAAVASFCGESSLARRRDISGDDAASSACFGISSAHAA